MSSGTTAGWPAPDASKAQSAARPSVPEQSPAPVPPPPAAIPPAPVPPAPVPPVPPSPPPVPAAPVPPAVAGPVIPVQYLPGTAPAPVSALPVTAYPYPYAGTVYPYPVPYPAPVAPPPRRTGVGTWIVAILSVLVMCLAGGVGATVGVADYTGALRTTADWQPGSGAGRLPPSQNAPASEWDSWARRSADDIVAGQAKALLAGNESGFVGIADPSNARLVGDLQRRYRVLHAMGPGVWTQSISGLRPKGQRSWTGDIKIGYCFGTASCDSVELAVGSTWSVKSDRLVLADLEQSASTWNGPRPWEVDDLTVTTGKRVVMAAAKVNAWRLPEAIKAADRAAAVADTFAKWSAPPNRYVIFLAGQTDWKTWYGHEQPEWAAAWAVPVSDTTTEVVVRTQVVQQRDLEVLLTHELTHVTSLAGKRNGEGRSSWWLIEGIAEYATMVAKPVRGYEGIVPTRTFVKGKWNGDPAVDPPTASATLDEAAGRYGVAFLSVRRIADRYGQDKMLNFFGRVVHDNESVDAAATGALNVPWSTVRSDLATFIRTSIT